MGGLFGGSTKGPSTETRSVQRNAPPRFMIPGMKQKVGTLEGMLSDPTNFAEQLDPRYGQQLGMAMDRSGQQGATQQYFNALAPGVGAGIGASLGNLWGSLTGDIAPSQAAQDASRMAGAEAARQSKIAGMAGGQTMYTPGTDPTSGGMFQSGGTPLADAASGAIYRASMNPLMADINRQFGERQTAQAQGLQLANMMGNLAGTGEREAHNRAMMGLQAGQQMQPFANPLRSSFPMWAQASGMQDQHAGAFGSRVGRGTQQHMIPDWALGAQMAGMGMQALSPFGMGFLSG